MNKNLFINTHSQWNKWTEPKLLLQLVGHQEGEDEGEHSKSGILLKIRTTESTPRLAAQDFQHTRQTESEKSLTSFAAWNVAPGGK